MREPLTERRVTLIGDLMLLINENSELVRRAFGVDTELSVQEMFGLDNLEEKVLIQTLLDKEWFGRCPGDPCGLLWNIRLTPEERIVLLILIDLYSNPLRQPETARELLNGLMDQINRLVAVPFGYQPSRVGVWLDAMNISDCFTGWLDYLFEHAFFFSELTAPNCIRSLRESPRLAEYVGINISEPAECAQIQAHLLTPTTFDERGATVIHVITHNLIPICGKDAPPLNN